MFFRAAEPSQFGTLEVGKPGGAQHEQPEPTFELGEVSEFAFSGSRPSFRVRPRWKHLAKAADAYARQPICEGSDEFVDRSGTAIRRC